MDKTEASVWQGIYGQGYDARGDLFAKLLAKAGRHEFDDEYLELAVEYGEASPQPERFSVFYAWYALAHGGYEVALAEAEKAFDVRRVNGIVWKLLITCYTHFGKYMQAVWFQGLCHKFYHLPLELKCALLNGDEFLTRLSIALGFSEYAPIASRRVYMAEGQPQQKMSIFLGEPLYAMQGNAEDIYWPCVYSGCQGSLNDRGGAVAAVRENTEFVNYSAGDTVFEMFKASPEKTVDFSLPEGEAWIVPLAGTVDKQEITFSNATDKPGKSTWLGKHSYSFFRLDEPVSISSQAEMAVGRPIRLGHSPARHKLVLHIIVDALSWVQAREDNYENVPNLLEFFRQGVIFNQNFSVCEYTYPSLATIETGLYPHRSQIFNEQAAVALSSEHVTLAEQMGRLGYHCVNVQGVGNGVFNGVTRGYEHLLVNPYCLPAAEGVERTIQQIEAFDECDQFIFLHIMDSHPWDVRDYQIAWTAQTHMSMADRLEGMEERQASVRLQCTPFYMAANRTGIRNLDRSLGVLFAYLQQHFAEDEYVVELCSDHGVSIYDKVPYIMGDKQTGAALMLRGAGVPSLGFVDDELTSTLDIYPIMSKLCGFPLPEGLDGNLPAAFGGSKREYCISNTMFPKQTYKMRLRLENCQMDLESKSEMYQDGTVDLTEAHLWASRRDGRPGGVTEAERARMLEIVREHTASFDNMGIQWPMLQGEV